MAIKNAITVLTVILSMFFVGGCATVSKQEAMTADFGSLPAGYQDEIRAFMSPRLKDPYSAMYSFGIPRKGVSRDGLIFGAGKHYGWVVPVGVNAKNSFGGYVGEQGYYFMFIKGRIWDASSAWGVMANYAD